jgi:predicted nucleic acid-binding protein
MVLAYALLGVRPFRDDALEALRRPEDIVVPDLFYPEFANVLWQWVRTRGLGIDRAVTLLRDVEAIVTETVPASRMTHEALELAVAVDVAVYDALFAVLAIQRHSKLVSYDRKLLRKLPDVVISPSDFLASDA